MERRPRATPISRPPRQPLQTSRAGDHPNLHPLRKAARFTALFAYHPLHWPVLPAGSHPRPFAPAWPPCPRRPRGRGRRPLIVRDPADPCRWRLRPRPARPGLPDVPQVGRLLRLLRRGTAVFRAVAARPPTRPRDAGSLLAGAARSRPGLRWCWGLNALATSIASPAARRREVSSCRSIVSAGLSGRSILVRHTRDFDTATARPLPPRPSRPRQASPRCSARPAWCDVQRLERVRAGAERPVRVASARGRGVLRGPACRRPRPRRPVPRLRRAHLAGAGYDVVEVFTDLGAAAAWVESGGRVVGGRVANWRGSRRPRGRRRAVPRPVIRFSQTGLEPYAGGEEDAPVRGDGDQAAGPRPWLFIRIPGPVSDALGSRTRVEVRSRTTSRSSRGCS